MFLRAVVRAAAVAALFAAAQAAVVEPFAVVRVADLAVAVFFVGQPVDAVVEPFAAVQVFDPAEAVRVLLVEPLAAVYVADPAAVA